MDQQHQSHELGWLIKSKRESLSMSRRSLSRSVGCRDRWIERLEDGDLAVHHAPTLGKVTTVLGLDPVEVDCLSGGQLEGWYPGLRTWFLPKELSASAVLTSRRLQVRRRQTRECGLAATGGLA